MHESHRAKVKEIKEATKSSKRVLLIGQPNVGKSVVFSLLTGRYVTVSNYPGTTVEVMSGKSTVLGKMIVDTPGVGTFVPRSEDEIVTLKMLLSEGLDFALQVGDAKNLHRTLLLTLALSEAEIPLVLDLNMKDEAERRGYIIDVESISHHLGIPVVTTVATEKRGKDELIAALKSPRKPTIRIAYEAGIEEAVKKIAEFLPDYPVSKRFVALVLLAGNISTVDEILSELSKEKRRAIKDIILNTQAQFSEPLSQVIMYTRALIAEKIVRECLARKESARFAARFFLSFEDISTHPIAGFFVLAAVLYALYQVVGVFAAGTAVDFFESIVFGEYILPPVVNLLERVPIPLLRDFFIGEYGLITMGLTYAIAIVFPIITFFFLMFSLLEDSGYLPRLAVMLNKVFARMGLNGKAVVPMVLGLGCGTMATLVTRVLESRRERIIATFLLALGIPCSAQLGVILGMFGGIGGHALILFFGLLSLQLLMVGWLASKIIPGGSSMFIAELPPYRLPRIDNVFIKTYFRSKWFLKEAVPLFLLGTAFLFFVDLVGLLKAFSDFVSPIVSGWLGLPAKAAEAFVLGFLRRDYGAAGLFVMFEKGLMDKLQAFVSLMVITLFVPCIANLFVIIKERGPKIAAAIATFVLFYAFLAGGVINFMLRFIGVTF